ncbi:MAG: isochorismatase family protein [Caulobacteraceae bacterium]
MTVTSLDPKTALIVIDLQKGVVPRPAAPPLDGVVKNAVALTKAFRGRESPVVLVNVAGAAPGRTEQPRGHMQLPAGWTDLIPELDRRPQDHVVTKRTRGAFTNTDLEVHLRGLGVTQVVLAGVATSSGVEVTAHQAYELGFNVTLATDAMTDGRADAHAYSLTQVFPRLGETETTREIIDLLEKGA